MSTDRYKPRPRYATPPEPLGEGGGAAKEALQPMRCRIQPGMVLRDNDRRKVTIIEQINADALDVKQQGPRYLIDAYGWYHSWSETLLQKRCSKYLKIRTPKK